MDVYFGTYQTFETASKKDAALLLGSDNIVGDRYRISIETNGDQHCARLINRFNQDVGFFDESFSRKLSVLKARDFTLTAILSFVAYTNHPEPGRYWGEMAVIGYAPQYKEEFEAFIGTVCTRMGEGTRTSLNLNDANVQRIIESKGTWVPDQKVPLPKTEKGTAIMKSKQSLNDKIVEQGRAKNKGCYVISWIFIIAVIAAVALGLKSCGIW